MLVIKGELCYSPEPPSKYGADGFGHGVMFGHDLQLWNLMYLSIPQVDDFLRPNVDAQRLYHSMPNSHTGACVSAVRGANHMRLFPKLRDWLKMPPVLFCTQIDKLKDRYHILAPAVHIPEWHGTIWTRARIVEAMDPAHQSFKKYMQGLKEANP